MLETRRAPNPTINKAQCLELVPFPALCDVGIQEPPRLPGHPWSSHNKCSIFMGVASAHGKKFGVSARGKLKLAVFPRYPDSARAELGAGIAGEAWKQLLILQ